MTTIYLIGDLHVGENSIYQPKKKLLDSLINKAKDNQNALVIIPGDLTENGSGKGKLCCFTCSNNCSGENQTDQFINEVYKPLYSANKNLFISHGNHDESTDNLSYPILDFVKKVHGATDKGCYTFQKNNLTFVCLGKYPDSHALNFFQGVINLTKDQYPYIIFFHYNIEGMWSEFWTNDEKNAFKQFIDKKNIIGILHGHTHQTYSSTIRTENSLFNTFCGSGLGGYAKLIVDPNNTNINFSYILP